MLPHARALSSALALGVAACANLPPKRWPHFVEHSIDAEFVVADDGRLEFPATSADLVVHDLELSPAPLDEGFGPGAIRWFRYAPGTAVTLHSALRTYGGADDDAAATLAALLRRARHVAHRAHDGL